MARLLLSMGSGFASPLPTYKRILSGVAMGLWWARIMGWVIEKEEEEEEEGEEEEEAGQRVLACIPFLAEV